MEPDAGTRRHTSARTSQKTPRAVVLSTHACTQACTQAWRQAWTDGRTDGRTDASMDGRTDAGVMPKTYFSPDCVNTTASAEMHGIGYDFTMIVRGVRVCVCAWRVHVHTHGRMHVHMYTEHTGRPSQPPSQATRPPGHQATRPPSHQAPGRDGRRLLSQRTSRWTRLRRQTSSSRCTPTAHTHCRIRAYAHVSSRNSWTRSTTRCGARTGTPLPAGASTHMRVCRQALSSTSSSSLLPCRRRRRLPTPPPPPLLLLLFCSAVPRIYKK